MSNKVVYSPLYFCLCGPIASGKSSLCRRLVQSDPTLRFSVSTTTRSPRPGEQDGREYFFVDKAEFERRVEQGRFVEYAAFGKNLYGTETLNTDFATKGRQDLVLDIEVQGIESFKQKFGNEVITIFVFPPSVQVLKERIAIRGDGDPDYIQQRLEIARGEVEVLRSPGFSDYLLVNEDFDRCLETARAIIAAERVKFRRFAEERLSALFKGLA